MLDEVTTPMNPPPTFQHPSTRTHPVMADVWAELSAGGQGTLADAVAHRVEAHAPLVPVYVHDSLSAQPQMRLLPMVDPLAWSLLKHAIQAALVVSVVLFALYGGRAPLMALGYVGTGLLLMGVLVLADRHEREPGLR